MREGESEREEREEQGENWGEGVGGGGGVGGVGGDAVEICGQVVGGALLHVRSLPGIVSRAKGVCVNYGFCSAIQAQLGISEGLFPVMKQ